MKKLFFLVAAILTIAAVIFFMTPREFHPTEIQLKRIKHEQFLADSPFKSTKNLSKNERKKLGLPPNAYNERLWELTMNPALGYPTPYLVDLIDVSSINAKTSPGAASQAWVERGPNNVGGRTRVAFYDPTDTGDNTFDNIEYNRVFAGGVGGGLWKNENINDRNSSWTIIPGLAANLSVNCFAIDPHDENTFYVGTGEQYTNGAAVGDGLYKSTNGGNTWQPVNIPIAGRGTASSPNNLFKAGIFYINDIVARSVNGLTELYVGVGTSIYSSPNFNIGDPNNILGVFNAGIYRSTDDGLSWSRNNDQNLQFPVGEGSLPVTPNDFELGADGTLYMGSINTPGFGGGGGRIYSSVNGLTWTLLETLNDGNRVELAASKTNPNLMYVLAEVGRQANLFKTEDKFATLPRLPEPNDADLNIPNTDFTRQQAFYDLMIETSPLNDAIIYVGGINMHASYNGGLSWNQVSKWSNNANMDDLNIPFVHADIHSLNFHPTDPTKAVIGSDGGVSLALSLPTSITSANSIRDRILGYNVTQFYYGDIAQADFEDGDEIVGGTQDNGSPIFLNATLGTGLSNTFDFLGGDGSYSAIDDDGQYMVLGYTDRFHIYLEYPLTNTSNSYTISDEDDGDFINVAELDSRFDILYSNSETPTGANSITACTLGPQSAQCIELTGASIADGRATAMQAAPFPSASPTLVVGTENSRLYLIQNSNSNFAKTIIDIGSPDFLGSVSDIEFGNSSQEIFVTFHNYGVNNIWYTANGGTTWSQKDGNLPDIPVKAILRNPLQPNEVIIGTQTGVYSTADFDSDNPTWTISMNGMTNVPVYDLDLRVADNTVLATTHGRGMFTGKFTAGTVSIANPEITQQMRVFPTQTASSLFIESDRSFTNVDIAIYNLSGQQVYQNDRSISNSRETIEVSSLASGIYFLKIQGDGMQQTTRFLKE